MTERFQVVFKPIGQLLLKLRDQLIAKPALVVWGCKSSIWTATLVDVLASVQPGVGWS